MHYPALSSVLRSAIVAAEFKDWLSASGAEDLLDAAELLGGPMWQTTAQRTITAARNDLARHLPQLRRLRKLLQFELVDSCEELAGRFFSVHPDDPRADSARRSAEALDRGIRALEQAAPVRLEAA